MVSAASRLSARPSARPAAYASHLIASGGVWREPLGCGVARQWPVVGVASGARTAASWRVRRGVRGRRDGGEKESRYLLPLYIMRSQCAPGLVQSHSPGWVKATVRTAPKSAHANGQRATGTERGRERGEGRERMTGVRVER